MSENESTLKVIRYDIKYHKPAMTLGQLSCGLTEVEANLELMPETDVTKVENVWQAFLTYCRKKAIFSKRRMVNNAECLSVFINARYKRSFDRRIDEASLDILGKSSPVPLKAMFWRVNGFTLGTDARPDLEERWKTLGFPEDFEPKLEWTKKTLNGATLAEARKALEEQILRESNEWFCSVAELLLVHLLGRDTTAKEKKLIRLLQSIRCNPDLAFDARQRADRTVREYLAENGLEKLVQAVDACKDDVLMHVLDYGLPTVEELNVQHQAVQLEKEKEKNRHELIAADLAYVSKNTEASLWF